MYNKIATRRKPNWQSEILRKEIKAMDNNSVSIDAFAVQGRMQAARKQRKLTYDKLEELTGIPHATLHRYFNGNPEKIPMSAISTISDAMDVSYRYILGWEIPDKEKIAAEIAKIISPLSETDQGLVLALAREVAQRSKSQ